MSVENLKEYACRCATDPELLAVAKEIGVTDIGVTAIEEHMRHSGSLGLDWTMDDLVAFRREVIGDGTEDFVDLTEEELEQVAGGVVTVTLAAVGVAGVVAGAAVAGVAVGGATAAGQGGW